MDGDFRDLNLTRAGGLKQTGLVADAGLIDWFLLPVSLLAWQEARQSKWLDRVDIVAEVWTIMFTARRCTSHSVGGCSPRLCQPQKRRCFTRFNLLSGG